MVFKAADRVQEISSTVGTGPFVVTGAPTGFQTWLAGLGNGNTAYYTAYLDADWEVGETTLTGGNTLSRTVIASSNANFPVDFPAGAKRVFLDYPASRSVYTLPTGKLNVDVSAVTGTMAQFDAALSDGNFVYQNQAATLSTLTTGAGVLDGQYHGTEFGGARQGSGGCYLDLHSTQGTDYEVRIIREPGTDGAFFINNTGVGEFHLTNYGAAGMVFNVNGAERMRINSAGQVGIGVASPTASSKLHVVGNVVAESLASNDGYFRTKNTVADWIMGQLGALGWSRWSLYNNLTGGECLTVAQGGNFGVGVYDPLFKLHVGGTTGLGGNVNVNGNMYFDAGRVIEMNGPGVSTLRNPADAGAVSVYAGSTSGYLTGMNMYGGGYAGYENTLTFLTHSAERMRISDNGRVGINGGTNFPSRLHITQTGDTSWNGAEGLTIGESTQAPNYYLKHGMFINSSGGWCGYLQQISIGNPASFTLNPGGGNVGVNTGTPAVNLHVKGLDDSYTFGVSGATTGIRMLGGSVESGIEGVDAGLLTTWQPLRVGGSQLNFNTMGINRGGIRSDGVWNLFNDRAPNTPVALLSSGDDGNFRLKTTNGDNNGVNTVMGKFGLFYADTPVALIDFYRGGSADSIGMNFKVNNSSIMFLRNTGAEFTPPVTMWSNLTVIGTTHIGPPQNPSLPSAGALTVNNITNPSTAQTVNGLRLGEASGNGQYYLGAGIFYGTAGWESAIDSIAGGAAARLYLNPTGGEVNAGGNFYVAGTMTVGTNLYVNAGVDITGGVTIHGGLYTLAGIANTGSITSTGNITAAAGGASAVLKANGDVNLDRGNGSGALYFGQTGLAYHYYNGSYHELTGGELLVNGGWAFTGRTNVWQTSSDGVNRAYYALNSATYAGFKAGYYWQNSAGTNVMILDEGGALTTSGTMNIGSTLTVSGTGSHSIAGPLAVQGAWAWTDANVSVTTGGGLKAFTSSGDILANSGAATLEARGSTTAGAKMAFHRAGAFAIWMGLDSDNIFRLGGWSAGLCWSCDMGGNFTATGNVAAFSDERLKKNWRDVRPDFVERLAEVKSGVYERTDIEMTQAGVSAQALQQVLPEAVNVGDNDMLTVAYGNAALLSAVELAKMVVALSKRVTELEEKLNGT